LYHLKGSGIVEIAYLPLTGGTVSGNLLVGGNLGVVGSASLGATTIDGTLIVGADPGGTESVRIAGSMKVVGATSLSADLTMNTGVTTLLRVKSSLSAALHLENTSDALNAKKWQIVTDTSVLAFRTMNDAESSATNWIVVTRIGEAVSSINLAATTVSVTGILATSTSTVSGLLTVGTTSLFTPGMILGLDLSSATTAVSGFHAAVAFDITTSVATTGATYGLEARVFATHTVGTTTGVLLGIAGAVDVTGIGGTTSEGRSIQAAAAVTNGTLTLLSMFYVLSPTITGTGVIGTAIGLNIQNITGATTNFAIKTNGGRVSLGSLPVAAAGLAAGDLWNNAGVVNIV
jgi:hypothetical protein